MRWAVSMQNWKRWAAAPGDAADCLLLPGAWWWWGGVFWAGLGLRESSDTVLLPGAACSWSCSHSHTVCATAPLGARQASGQRARGRVTQPCAPPRRPPQRANRLKSLPLSSLIYMAG
jgi:hypothetical protein